MPGRPSEVECSLLICEWMHLTTTQRIDLMPVLHSRHPHQRSVFTCKSVALQTEVVRQHQACVPDDSSRGVLQEPLLCDTKL